MSGDHRGGAGDLQNNEADDAEELREEADDRLDGSENLEIDVCEVVARSLGDLSVKGSRGGELKSRQTVFSRKPMAAGANAIDLVDWSAFYKSCMRSRPIRKRRQESREKALK